MAGPDFFAVLFLAGALIFGALSLLFYFFARRRPLALERHGGNPILSPDPGHWWESEAVFNPAAIVHDGRVHLFYRALGRDGVSRIGHASSENGIYFTERSLALDQGPGFALQRHEAKPLSYRPGLYASGGGWGGTEDPRAVKLEDRAYLSFGIFENWESLRLALTSLPLRELQERRWRWEPLIPLSPRGETHKNWVLFPEKIGGKFAILHTLTPSPTIEYVERLEDLRERPIRSNNNRGGRAGQWDAFVRGAGAPPIKTPEGWLLFYHGMDPAQGPGYKVGAMLLDLENPTKIRYRSSHPVLKPDEWYENDWKPGVVYASGAVVWGDDVLVYYGGGDKYVAAARANLADFLRKLTHREHAVLEPITVNPRG